MRRAIHAIRINMDPKVAVQILTICINQWMSTLCSRMLKEIIKILEEEKMDAGGLDAVLSGLLNTESNLWFAEV